MNKLQIIALKIFLCMLKIASKIKNIMNCFKTSNEKSRELFIRLHEEKTDNKLSSWALSKRYDRKSQEFDFFFSFLIFYAAFNCIFTFFMAGMATWILFCYPIAQYCFCNTASSTLEMDERVFKVGTMRLLITANKSISFFIVLYALARVIL